MNVTLVTVLVNCRCLSGAVFDSLVLSEVLHIENVFDALKV